jgi:hypothetical protein
MKKKDLVFSFLAIFFVAFGGCSATEDPNGAVARTPCGELQTIVVNGLNLLDVWPKDDTYGVNSFYLWIVDDASTPEKEEYYFHSTGEKVLPTLPQKDWQIPTTDWSAIRFNLDGFDPRK